MGAGIAQLAALSGCEVVVQEVNEQALAAGLARIDELFAKAVQRRRVSADEASQRRAALRGTVSWEGFDRVEVVVEAAIEDAQVKRGVFRELAERTPASAILATNTSALLVSRLQEGLPHPQRVAGLHFFNPVHKMPLVEVVRTTETSAEVLDRLTRFAIDLGKTPVRVGDRPGFVVNRVLMPYLNEALLLVGEGLKIQDVDRLMRRFGMPVGPLELLDQVGLDVAAHVAALVREQSGVSLQAHPGFEAMRQKGWLGEKSGTGFYVHKGKSSTVNTAAQELIGSLGSGAGELVKLPPAARLAEARDRLVLLMVNEAALVLSEGLAEDAQTINLAMVFGTGWAPHRGGPLRYADDRGLADVVRALQGLAGRLGPRFAPCAELKRRVEAAQAFRT
jgi:3-hydroxyacyl-CoA dehydrogenase/enoyl-CoA hydratase/3-hydroxybutyryl-CoA epimerase